MVSFVIPPSISHQRLPSFDGMFFFEVVSPSRRGAEGGRRDRDSFSLGMTSGQLHRCHLRLPPPRPPKTNLSIKGLEVS